jgi:hypothetical protein
VALSKRILLAVALAGTLVVLAAPASASFPAPQGRVLVLSEDQLAPMPELLRPGADPIPAGAPLGIRGTAAMSPDGTRIAMIETLTLPPILTDRTLLVGDLLGSRGGVVATNVFGRPAWSPDGNSVAYAGDHYGNWDIFTVAVDASGDPAGAPVDLTASSSASDVNPRWAPDGHAIAFESNRTGDLDIYEMHPDGTGVHDLTSSPGANTLGDWSPDSQRIVFSSMRSGNGDVYSIPAAGGPALRLTTAPSADTRPAWSPDGGTIAYSSDADGDNDVYETTPTGAGAVQVTHNTHEDLVQDWQPLHDFSPPVVHALPSSGRRGRPVRLRFRISEDTRRAGVTLAVSYAVHNGSGEAETSRLIDPIVSGKVYTFGVPSGFLRGASRIRFCVQAYDPSLNESKRSCARYRFVRTKKR